MPEELDSCVQQVIEKKRKEYVEKNGKEPTPEELNDIESSAWAICNSAQEGIQKDVEMAKMLLLANDKQKIQRVHTGDTRPGDMYYYVDPRWANYLYQQSLQPTHVRPKEEGEKEDMDDWLSGNAWRDPTTGRIVYYGGFNVNTPKEGWRVPGNAIWSWNYVPGKYFEKIDPSTFRQHYPDFMKGKTGGGWQPVITLANGDRYYLQPSRSGNGEYDWVPADPYEMGYWGYEKGEMVYYPGGENPKGKGLADNKDKPIKDKDGKVVGYEQMEVTKGEIMPVHIPLLDKGLTDEEIRSAWEKGYVTVRTDTGRGIVYGEINQSWYNANGKTPNKADPSTIKSTDEMINYISGMTFNYPGTAERINRSIADRNKRAEEIRKKYEQLEAQHPGGTWEGPVYLPNKPGQFSDAGQGLTPEDSGEGGGGGTGGREGDKPTDKSTDTGGSAQGVGAGGGYGGGGTGGRTGDIPGTTPVYFDSGAGETLIDPIVDPTQGMGWEELWDYKPWEQCSNDINLAEPFTSNLTSEVTVTPMNEKEEGEEIDTDIKNKLKEKLSGEFTIKDMKMNEDGTISLLLGPLEGSYVENAEVVLNMADFKAIPTGRKKFKSIAITPGKFKATDDTIINIDDEFLRLNAGIFKNKPLVLVDFSQATEKDTHKGNEVGTVLASYYCPDYGAIIYEGEFNDGIDLDLSTIEGSSVGMKMSKPAIGRHIALIPKCNDNHACLRPQDANARIIDMAEVVNMPTKEEIEIRQQLIRERKPLVSEIVAAEVKAGKINPTLVEDRMRELYGKNKATLELMAAELKPDVPMTNPKTNTQELEAANLSAEDRLERAMKKDPFWSGIGE